MKVLVVDLSCLHSRCGDAENDILSVYCVHHSCQGGGLHLCDKRLPHDNHGCIKRDQIHWDKAHNVRNFSTKAKGDATGKKAPGR